MAAYDALCKEADDDFEGFWARLARDNVVWTKPFTRTLDESNAPFYQWFDDGELNASANCLDRHMGTPVENKTAIIFEADDGTVTQVSYKELLARVSQFANALKAQGIQKGDRVIVYMPMTIEGVIAMQACARIGATHSVVFGGFSAKALQERIIDAGAVAVITANYQLRGGKELPLKAIVDDGIALGGCESIKTVLVYERTPTACNMVAGRDKTFDRGAEGPEHRMRADAGGRRASALHPLHLRLHRQAQGRAARHRRLPAVGQADDGLDLRHPARRRVLVHRRHRLDHRPHLRRLRPAGGRRDAGGVRGHARPSRMPGASGR